MPGPRPQHEGCLHRAGEDEGDGHEPHVLQRGTRGGAGLPARAARGGTALASRGRALDPASAADHLLTVLALRAPAASAGHATILGVPRWNEGPMVGRAGELAALLRHVDGAVAGRPSGVLVSGDAGVGKTRLLDELA